MSSGVHSAKVSTTKHAVLGLCTWTPESRRPERRTGLPRRCERELSLSPLPSFGRYSNFRIGTLRPLSRDSLEYRCHALQVLRTQEPAEVASIEKMRGP